MFGSIWQCVWNWISSLFGWQQGATGTLSGTLMQAADQVVVAAGNIGVREFAALFDPGGVRCSPYQRTEPSDKILQANEFGEWIVMNPPQYVWGTRQGSGDPIEGNVRAYFNEFVTDHPYHLISTGKPILVAADFQAQGNLINNLLTSYPLPQYRMVEYYQPGTGNGFDWTSLIVVLKSVGPDQWTLVGLAHGSWTI